MTDTTDLIQRLRTAWTYCGVEQVLRFEAADALEQQAAEIAALRADAERWSRWVRMRVSAGPSMPGSPNTFRLPLPACPPNVMRGSVAQHLDAAIDAALRQEQPT